MEKDCDICTNELKDGGHYCKDLCKGDDFELKLGQKIDELESKNQKLQDKLNCLKTSQNCEGYNCYFANRVKELEAKLQKYEQALKVQNSIQAIQEGK
ncbi:MAG: hypothetical protein US20_C0005G0034 [Candidatus Pacebacteria bacterium GW2011_GWF1_36_5]|nr:MAG: hypothetical protein US20_C0005G0034 [Candidatus Pacebacteria bacterium GW2011_GWF1_36_5]